MSYHISWSLRVQGLAPRVSSIHQNQTRDFMGDIGSASTGNGFTSPVTAGSRLVWSCRPHRCPTGERGWRMPSHHHPCPLSDIGHLALAAAWLWGAREGAGWRWRKAQPESPVGERAMLGLGCDTMLLGTKFFYTFLELGYPLFHTIWRVESSLKCA
jgi:hypothetical protein